VLTVLKKNVLPTRNPLVSHSVSVWSLKGKTLIIAEKPKAAKKIAEALSSKYTVRRYHDIPYYEIKLNDSTIIIASAVGHLYELHTNVRGYPVFEYKWVPAYIANMKKKYVKPYIELLDMLFKNCDYYVNACDYDIEGSVIGYILIKFHGDLSRAFRAKFSSLMAQEIKGSFNQLISLDYNMIEAGLSRHELDWMWGINISRALMQAIYTNTKKKIVLSAGRVQTPTLKHVVDYEIQRKLFIPIPQYSVSVVAKKDSHLITADYSYNPVARVEDARIIKDKLEKTKYLLVKSYTASRQKYNPPPPFNLSDLQEEAAKIYGFSPMKTQEIAEQLYLEALISYPRTNSQKLPPTLSYRDILDKISNIPEYRGLVSKLLSETKGLLKPVEGEKEDPAHPAIYPTGVLPRKLTREQFLIYDLIVRRFLAVFAPQAVFRLIKAEFTTLDYKYSFETSGLSVEYPGWVTYYHFHTPSSKLLPSMTPGEKLEVVKVMIRESYTKPPPKLKKIDILRWMENVGIGTESTRAIIIEKLFERGYLKNTKAGVDLSDLGIGIIEVIEKFFPDLISVELTRKFEVLMEDVMKGLRTREQVLNEAKKVISDLLAKFNERINDVGFHLAKKLSLTNDYSKCVIPECRGDSFTKGFCRIHYLAYENLLKNYEEWRVRKGISFNDYLSKIAKLKSTGTFVKEVIRYQLEAGKTN
jgi:DNA topoisomerase-1